MASAIVMSNEPIGHDDIRRWFAATKKSERLAHAYLLVGPTGIGKRAMARWLAGQLLGASEPTKHPDYLEVERGDDPKTGKRRADIVLDQVHSLRGWLARGALAGSVKVAVLTGAQELNREAGNALLKNLEEPQPGTFLLLTASSAEAVMPTIRSRCQLVALHRLPTAELAAALRQRGLNDERSELLAALADGCPGLALKLADAENFAEYDARRERLLELFELPQPERWSALDRLVPEKLSFNEAVDRTAEELGLLTELVRDAWLIAQGKEGGLRHCDRLPQLQHVAQGSGADGLATLLEALLSAAALNRANVGHRAVWGSVATAFK